MEDFRIELNERYHEKAVKLMEEVEERRREEEMQLIAEQAGRFRKSLTKKDKDKEGNLKTEGQ